MHIKSFLRVICLLWFRLQSTFIVGFWIKPFFYIFKHHIQHYSETSTVLNTHQPINQAPKDNRRKHESKSSIVLLSWDTQTQQHERHDSLSAGRLLNMDQLTQVHTCLCVSCTQWPPHIALPLNRNKTVTNTSAVSPVWPAGHSPEAELLTQDGFKKTRSRNLNQLSMFSFEFVFIWPSESSHFFKCPTYHLALTRNWTKNASTGSNKTKRKNSTEKRQTLVFRIVFKTYNTDF